MSDGKKTGVTKPNGQVWDCKGLYICDGSLLCSSVGVNPSATILALAERNVLSFIQTRLANPQWPDGDSSLGAREYASQVQAATNWAVANRARLQLQPPTAPSPAPRSSPIGITFMETMQGYISEPTRPPLPAEREDDTFYSDCEARGRPCNPVQLNLRLKVENLAAFLEDEFHEMRIQGEVVIRLPGTDRRLTYQLDPQSKAQLFASLRKPHAIDPRDWTRLIAQSTIATRLPGYRNYSTRKVATGAPAPERFLRYYLKFVDEQQRDWSYWGYKRIRNDPGPDAWRDTSSLYSCLWQPSHDPVKGKPSMNVRGAGVVHVDLEHFLFDQIRSIKVTGTNDPARKVWAVATFGSFFFGSLQRIYQPGASDLIDALLHAPHTKPGQ